MLKEVLFLVLAALCLSDAVSIKSHIADINFVQKQKKIHELLLFVKQNVLTDVEFYTVGRNYEIENNMEMYKDKDVVKEFLHYYKHGVLSRDAIFSPFYEEHLNEMILLFKLFYNAKDFEIFYKTAAWARLYMNSEVFTQAFYVAVFYRPDCKYIIPMSPYEVNPNYFFDSNVIQEAQRIKMMHGNAWIEYSSCVTINLKINIYVLYSFIGLTSTGNMNNTDIYVIYSNYTDTFSEENKLDYFMEDFSLNSFYFYFRQIFPFWLNSKEYNIPREYRGVFYLYIHQQLIARYYLERLSNDLGEIEDFNLQKPFYPGFYSSIVFGNGVVMPQRKSYYNVPYYKYQYLTEMDLLELRFMDAIDSGLVLDNNGKFVNIYTPEGLNILGNLIEGNSDTCNLHYYGMYEMLARNVFGSNFDYADKNKIVPSAMQFYSTSLRDPAFYALFNKISNYVDRYKKHLPAYSYSELNFPGVKIESVNIDKLWTYFDYCDATINNAVFFNSFKEGSSLHIKARRYCLNYKPFTYRLSVNSDKDVKAIVKIFLGPAIGQDMSYLKKYYKYFVMMEEFDVLLKQGMNNIEYASNEATYRMSSDKLYKKLQNAVSGSEPFTYYEKVYAYPERLTLPKGKPEGMKFKMFFYLSLYDESKTMNIELPIFGKMIYDGKPSGFPLDRPMYTWKSFTPNMYFKDVYIYNTKDSEKFSHY
ncbi:hypothetical protein HZH66_010153 [Vespula vulgaris]|uniref:Uncharacterized protein n=1 Tax=Vespula vulgaris TaxID=7454 RepID=A0A834JID5_VESVU|nr:arylphorin subunit alpha isoform X1 [Vespula vulgaris]KAF7389016.1 hypothetical protein HZH66_010153 [Vespula vulgaris]